MKRFLLFLALVALLSGFSSYSQSDDKILWKQDSTHRFDFLALHPNGNIIGGHDAEVYEYDGQNGSFIRKLNGVTNEIDIDQISFSKNGKNLLCCYSGCWISDYTSGKIFDAIGSPPHSSSAVFFPDNKRVISCEGRKDYKCDLKIYNLEKRSFEKSITINNLSWPDRICISDDGSMVAIAGTFVENPGSRYNEKTYSRVLLYNPNTLELIKMIESVTCYGYRKAEFTPDNKFLGVLYSNDLRIYNVDTGELLRTYDWHKKGGIGLTDFCFIGNDKVAFPIFESLYPDTSRFEIDDFLNEKTLYMTNEFGCNGSTVAFNSKDNIIILTNARPYLSLYALKLDKLLSVDNDGQNEETIKVSYTEQKLIIDNIFRNEVQMDIEIVNISGVAIQQYRINPNQYNDRIELPIILQSGVYIVQIIAGEKSYCAKLAVVR